MTIQGIPMIVKPWLALILIFGLLPLVCSAQASFPLDEALMGAARRGDLQRVKTLLERGADVKAKDEKGTTALMASAEEGHLETMNLLLDRDTDPNAKDNEGWTAL
ncbi:MAG: ankyrin repeat domain-containing protein [Desulfomonilaceae bacterium]